jgi:hypothetical protein
VYERANVKMVIDIETALEAANKFDELIKVQS